MNLACAYGIQTLWKKKEKQNSKKQRLQWSVNDIRDDVLVVNTVDSDGTAK